MIYQRTQADIIDVWPCLLQWKKWSDFFNLDGASPQKVEPLFISKVWSLGDYLCSNKIASFGMHSWLLKTWSWTGEHGFPIGSSRWGTPSTWIWESRYTDMDHLSKVLIDFFIRITTQSGIWISSKHMECVLKFSYWSHLACIQLVSCFDDYGFNCSLWSTVHEEETYIHD